MPKGYRRLQCVVCDRDIAACGTLSKRGKCQDCREALMRASSAQINAHRGPFFQHWRRQMAASVGGVLLDEFPELKG